MKSYLMFQKALLLLDRGNFARAEEALNETVSLAEQEADEVTLAGALCCLGDFLHQQGRDLEAMPLLERVLMFSRNDDVLSYEINHAKEVILSIKKQQG